MTKWMSVFQMKVSVKQEHYDVYTKLRLTLNELGSENTKTITEK